MTDILRLLLILVLLTSSLSAYFLVVGVLFPKRIEKTQRAINQLTVRSFGVGFVNFLFFGVIAIVLFSVAENAGGFLQGVLTIPALIIAGLLALMLTFGLSAMVNELGVRLFAENPAWKQIVWGSAALTFACALPFVGWFILLPYVGFVGIGGVILGFFQKGE
jgi:hypothetical protein